MEDVAVNTKCQLNPLDRPLRPLGTTFADFTGLYGCLGQPQILLGIKLNHRKCKDFCDHCLYSAYACMHSPARTINTSVIYICQSNSVLRAISSGKSSKFSSLSWIEHSSHEAWGQFKWISCLRPTPTV